MSKVNVGFKYQSFKYDFAVNGGAISSISMGVFLPVCQLVGILIRPVTNLAGAGAIVDVGVVGATQAIIDNATDGATGDLTDYNIASFGFGTDMNTNLLGGFSPVKSIAVVGPAQVVVTISAFALTAGAFIGTIFYVEFP